MGRTSFFLGNSKGGYMIKMWRQQRVLCRVRSGASLVEVGLAIAAVALLVQLAIPLLVRSRESSRVNGCVENLRQLGRGMQDYHEQKESLPPAANWTAEGLDIDTIYKPGALQPTITATNLGYGPDITKANWVLLLLPYLGEQERQDAFRLDALISDAANAAGRSREFPLMTCPADDYNRADNLYLRVLSDGVVGTYARGNYGINGGSQQLQHSPGTLQDPVADGYQYTFFPETGTFEFYGNGIAGFNKTFRFADIHRGLGKTVAIDELRAGLHPVDSRGVWALGQIGGSVTFAQGIHGDAGRPIAR